jgi:hypothetical protein
MRTHVCYLDCHEAGLSFYLVIYWKTYYVHYSCFISICVLFTDSPSQLHILESGAISDLTIS